jgi:hypothetical protein
MMLLRPRWQMAQHMVLDIPMMNMCSVMADENSNGTSIGNIPVSDAARQGSLTSTAATGRSTACNLKGGSNKCY